MVMASFTSLSITFLKSVIRRFCVFFISISDVLKENLRKRVLERMSRLIASI
jgi:hypothetical protein